MRRTSFLNEKKKNVAATRLKTNNKDENSFQYDELNSEINRLLRSINMNFDFKNFRKAKLQPLEIVNYIFYKNVLILQYFSQLKKIIFNKEALILKALERNVPNKGLDNLFAFWSTKVRENLTNFFVAQKLLVLIDEIDQKMVSIESKKKVIEEQKKSAKTKDTNPIPNQYKPIIKEKIPNQYKPIIKEKDKDKKQYDFKDLKKDTNRNKNFSHNSYYNRRVGKNAFGYNKKDEKEKEKEIEKEKEKEKKSPEKSNINKKDYNTNVTNLDHYPFNVQQEKLGENILEITKKNKNIISFIDIDVFLQRIAQEKKIYDDTNDNDTLLNGFCIQHPNFIPTNTLISKIIGCFNYYYKEYLNEESDKNKMKYQMGNKRKTEYRPRYKHVENKVIINNSSKKIPFCLIDLMILFVDLHEKYSKDVLTKEIVEKIEKFYKTIGDIEVVKSKYKDDIDYSNKVINRVRNNSILRRTKTNKKMVYDEIFAAKSLLENKIRDENTPIAFFNILEYNSNDIAKELTRISYNILSKIQPKEFFKGVFTKNNKNVTSPNITAITKRFNQLSFWLIEEILSYDYPNDRAQIIEKFIDIGKELIDLNNFNDGMCIISGLGQMIINNLKQSWKNVSKKSNNVFQNLKNILNFQDNYKVIRDRIDDCLQNNIPYIPFLGPYNKRICFLEEYGPYVQNNTLINVDKIVLVQQILDQFFKFRTKQYNLMNSNNKEFIIFQCLDPAPEEELEKLASLLEPNFTLKDKKEHEKRVTNTEKNMKTNYEKNDYIL